MKTVFFLIFLLQISFAEVLLPLENYWKQLGNSAIVDSLNLKLRVGNKFQIMDGSRFCILEKKVIELKNENKFINGRWMVSEELLHHFNDKGWIGFETHAEEATTYPVVVIDAGHGGKDPGAIGLTGLQEKDVVLDISKRLRILLMDKPVTVKMVRTQDVFVDLHERCRMSNQWKASVFVSIHCNSNNNRSMHGYQMYRMDHKKVSPHKRANWSNKRYKLSEFLPLDKKGHEKNFSSFNQLFDWKDKESLTLSNLLNDQFEYRKTNIRTMPRSNLCVLRETFAPSVLVETDFISNMQIEATMNDPAWRQRAASDICNGILSYLGLGPES